MKDPEIIPEAFEELQRIPGLAITWRFREAKGKNTARPDMIAEVKVDGRPVRLAVAAKRTVKGEGLLIQELRELTRKTGLPVLFVTPYIAEPTADRLAAANINFVDLAGNAHVRLPGVVLHVGGRKPAPNYRRITRGEAKALTAPAAIRVIYAILVRPETRWTLRAMSRATGVALGWTAQVVDALRDEGLVRRTPKQGVYTHDRQALLRRWLDGYETVLRPRLILGRFAPAEGTLEATVRRGATRLLKQGARVRAALGGTWGADALVHYYRGPHVIVHGEPPARQWVKILRVVPDLHGAITFLAPVGPIQWEDTILTSDGPVAPPLILYAELLADPDPRAQELAERLVEQFPQLKYGKRY